MDGYEGAGKNNNLDDLDFTQNNSETVTKLSFDDVIKFKGNPESLTEQIDALSDDELSDLAKALTRVLADTSFDRIPPGAQRVLKENQNRMSASGLAGSTIN